MAAHDNSRYVKPNVKPELVNRALDVARGHPDWSMLPGMERWRLLAAIALRMGYEEAVNNYAVEGRS